MVEEDDLPVGSACRQLLVEPFELLAVHIIAVDREEPHAVLWLEAVVLLAAHVERLVLDLPGVVVIAQRRVELHAGVEERLVRPRELPFVVSGTLRSVQVVTCHQRKLEWKPRPPGGHLPRHSRLPCAGLTAVADDGELDGTIRVRQAQILRGHRQRQACQYEGDNGYTTHCCSLLATW